MDLLRSSGEAYAVQLTASGVKVKVELIERAQHGWLNLPLTSQGAQSLKLIVGSSNSRSIGPSHLWYDSEAF
jgi:acetyl esterase/lipase